ncbi:NAD(P)/FAD-dependent oxidoreductase [Agrococcus carbonis]|uniref:NADPH-dependent 2,4-dienoyl-CoA reductase, sulfur reductase n=1 Tax=Agrococcus carbonis TaxID=684552 RepID=A0A1H1RE25_9MICO|nr:FAD-dependent oxidoreductase [Agrococcus carbonis]SDS34027.1 NADPH-dependent 2,4-dienoyl-CoA reductase, sulfur reductase [Agrococcus carbonis]
MGIVIIGAGLAGATAATALRQQGYDGPLTLIGAEATPPYERPPLSKGYLLGTQPFDEALVHPEPWYAEHDVSLRLGTRATAIDRDRRVVRTASATDAAGGEGTAEEDVPYDQLLLATGAAPRSLRMEGVDDFVTLRTVGDSTRLKEAFAEGTKVAIVGAGWIGLEVAAAARTAGAEVTVFETAALPLQRVLGPEVATVFAELHRGHGVDLRLSTQVTPDDLRGADVRIAAIGVTPQIELAEQAGLAMAAREEGGGVAVDATLRTSDPRILAIGDIAAHDHPVLGRRIRVEHWDTAKRQAKAAAAVLLGGDEPYRRLPYFFTDQYDLGMEYWGNPGPAGYDRVDIEGSTDALAGDAFHAFWVRGDEVVAAMHVNDWDASATIRESVGSRRSAAVR